ncbi:N-acetyltransferase family protein [Peribacillus sp. NPDC046944]|uniref:GNAT family N-acetyltransferase n=1 Tax=unclassified Peribacillus TaxID=2675266 RepID=UPI003D00A0A2
MQIRKATENDITGIAHVHIKSWQSTYKGILPDSYLNSLNLETRKKNWSRNLKMLHSATYIAENGDGKIVGFAAGGPEQTNHLHIQGEVYAIYLLKEYQRQEIGRKLMKAVVDELVQKQHANLIIWALKDNPSRGFYEALGGRIISEKTVKMAGIELAEVGYGWDNILDILVKL